MTALVYTISTNLTTIYAAYAIITHEKTHSEDKPYTCNYCDKAYADNSGLDDTR